MSTRKCTETFFCSMVSSGTKTLLLCFYNLPNPRSSLCRLQPIPKNERNLKGMKGPVSRRGDIMVVALAEDTGKDLQ
jgi:hypothetical protein